MEKPPIVWLADEDDWDVDTDPAIVGELLERKPDNDKEERPDPN